MSAARINAIRIGNGRRAALSLSTSLPGFTPRAHTAQASINVEQAALSIGIPPDLALIVEHYLLRRRRGRNGTRRPQARRIRGEHLRVESRASLAMRVGWLNVDATPDVKYLEALFKRVEVVLSDPATMARLQCAVLAQTNLTAPATHHIKIPT